MKRPAPLWPGARDTVSVKRERCSPFFSRRLFVRDGYGEKGNWTTGRRRTKSAAKEAAATVRESNGMPAHNGAGTGRPDNEMNIETIRLRAFELFLVRGATHGNDLADRLNAERELRGARNR